MQKPTKYFEPLLAQLYHVGIASALPNIKVKEFWHDSGKKWLNHVAPHLTSIWVVGEVKGAYLC